MLGSKLIEMFKTLSKKELPKFKDYVSSPIYNKSDKVVHLFEIIKEEYPKCDSSNLDKEVVFKRLYPSKVMEDSSLRALMSQLTKLLENFFAFLEYESNVNLQERLKLIAFTERRLNSIYERQQKQSLQRAKKQKQSNELFYHQFRLLDIYFQFNIVNNNRDIKNSGLQELMYNLDLYYIASKLKYASALMNRQSVLATKYELHFLEEIFERVQGSDLYDISFVKIYYNLCMLSIAENSHDYYKELKVLMAEKSKELTRTEIRPLYIALSNYCIRQIKSGNTKYLYELFELHKKLLREKIFLFEDGFLSPHTYKNIVTVSLRVKEHDWTKKFIQEYRNKLHPDYRLSSHNYALASLNFSLQKYDYSKELLLEVQFFDDYYQLAYKILLIKNYYELEEMIVLKSSIEALRVYLIRQKNISTTNRMAYQNFVKFIQRLLRIKEGGTKKITDLLHDVQSPSRQVAERQWLIEKIEELKQLKK